MDEILTASEVAELLQIHPRTVYKLVKEGSLPGVSLAADGGLVVRKFLPWYRLKVIHHRRASYTQKSGSARCSCSYAT